MAEACSGRPVSISSRTHRTATVSCHRVGSNRRSSLFLPCIPSRYRVPAPRGWTEVPSDLKSLGGQQSPREEGSFGCSLDRTDIWIYAPLHVSIVAWLRHVLFKHPHLFGATLY